MHSISQLESKSSTRWTNIRELTEINVLDLSDAYPWISPDGLRLYFTQGYETNYLYCVSRPNLSATFSEQQLISSNIPEDALSCWLSNNELELYHVYNATLYYSKRNALNEAFSDPVIIDLTGCSYNFISAPSLTPDKQELYLFEANWEHNSRIIKFNRTDDLSYAYSETLNFPPDLKPDPGQLSKDGLKYILPLEDTYGKTRLYEMERSNFSEQFGALTLIEGINDDNYQSNSQPSVSAGGNTMVWVKNNNGLWSGNELYIAENDAASTDAFGPVSNFNIYPNPVSDRLTIDLREQTTISIRIYNSVGICVVQQVLTQPSNLIDLSSLAKGLYTLDLIAEKGFEQKKFVKE